MKFLMNGISGVRFHCNVCNTIWIATGKSYSTPYKTNPDCAYSNCPRCGESTNVLDKSKQWVELTGEERIYEMIDEDEEE